MQVKASSRLVFKAKSIRDVTGILESQGARIKEISSDHPVHDLEWSRIALAHGEFNFGGQFRIPLTVGFPEVDGVCVRIGLAGYAEARIGTKTVAIPPGAGCITRAGGDIKLDASFHQVVWRIDHRALLRKFHALSDTFGKQELNLGSSLDLTSSFGQKLCDIVRCMSMFNPDEDSRGMALIREEMEQACTVALLYAASYDQKSLLNRSGRSVAPWQVHRAEAFIEANWDKPLRIEDIAEASGTSARSLFRTFRQSRGCTPGQFATRIRLENAKQMLTDGDERMSVTAISLACGFSDSGQFSKAYRRTFGETPSITRQRAKRIVKD
jgi:AraC-like DNA-binding protein